MKPTEQLETWQKAAPFREFAGVRDFRDVWTLRVTNEVGTTLKSMNKDKERAGQLLIELMVLRGWA